MSATSLVSSAKRPEWVLIAPDRVGHDGVGLAVLVDVRDDVFAEVAEVWVVTHMAIPIAYWMLECRRCRSRRVVHDKYYKFVGHNYPYPAPGAGDGGRPLPKRYGCLKRW